MSDDLRYEVREGVAWITLNRPNVGNALTPAMHEDLRAAWADVRDNPDIRVAVLTGAGERHFCTGADVNRIAAEGGTSTGRGPMEHELHYTPRDNDVWKPTICAVNGLVAGAGLQFVADADIVVASTAAAFTDPHVDVGMVAGIEDVRLTRRLPLGSVLRLALMGRAYRMSGERAYQLGLVDELVAPDELAVTAGEMAAVLARNSPTAMSLTQQGIWRSLDTSLTEASEYAWALVRMHWGHPDFVEGPRAYAEKRAPEWAPPG